MLEIRPVTDGDIDGICRFLELHLGRGMRAEEHQRLFTYPWMNDKPGKGYIMVDGCRIVGFLGGIYADRAIQGRIERVCNLTTWCVLPEHRGNSISLLFAMINNSKQTVTNLSPTPVVEKMLRALRYEVLDTYKLFSLPLTHLQTLLTFPKAKITTDSDLIGKALTPEDRCLFDDHQGTGCGHLLMSLPERYCYAVWKRRKKKGISFSEILYIRNPDIFLQHLELARLHILWRDRTWLLAVDERLLGGRRPALVWPYRRVSMFKSLSLKREDIDNLYSELAIR
ncbi:MAG: hypothetical protein ABSH56_06430 [Bryobacteraceae bacterium]|jgi:hypothetical protein